MSEIKLIVTDLDGSFLKAKNTVCEENIAAVRAAQEKGIRVCGATSRCWGTCKRVAEQAGFRDLFVVNNGASILSVSAMERVFVADLDPEIIEPVLRLLLRYVTNLKTQGYIETVSTWDLVNDWNREVCLDDGTIFDPLASQNGFLLDTIEEVIQKSKECHAQIIAGNMDPARNNEMYYDLCGIGDFELTSAGVKGIEITPRGINKGSAVRFLADYYGVPRESVLCVGDNRNDIPMVSWAGVGVCVENGADALKDVADYITAPCYEAGFARAVERFAL